MRAALFVFIMLRAASAQTIVSFPPNYFSATLGTVKCAFWMQGSAPGSEIAIYNNGVLDPNSISHFPAPLSGTSIFPCPAPLDRFQISVSSTGVVTTSIVPLPPPPTQAYTDVAFAAIANGMTLILPSVPTVIASLQIAINQVITTNYTLNGRIVTFTTAPPGGAILLALYK